MMNVLFNYSIKVSFVTGDDVKCDTNVYEFNLSLSLSILLIRNWATTAEPNEHM